MKKSNLTTTIGRGDPKAILLNCAEVVSPDDSIIILRRQVTGEYNTYANTISYEKICGLLVHFQNLILDLN